MNFNDQKLFTTKKSYKVLSSEVQERKKPKLMFSVNAKEQNQLLVFNLTRTLLIQSSKLQCFMCHFTKAKAERMYLI